MIFRSHKPIPLGILKIGDEGFAGLHSRELGEYYGNVLIIKEATREEYIEWIKEDHIEALPHCLDYENIFKYYYEIIID